MRPATLRKPNGLLQGIRFKEVPQHLAESVAGSATSSVTSSSTSRHPNSRRRNLNPTPGFDAFQHPTPGIQYVFHNYGSSSFSFGPHYTMAPPALPSSALPAPAPLGRSRAGSNAGSRRDGRGHGRSRANDPMRGVQDGQIHLQLGSGSQPCNARSVGVNSSVSNFTDGQRIVLRRDSPSRGLTHRGDFQTAPNAAHVGIRLPGQDPTLSSWHRTAASRSFRTYFARLSEEDRQAHTKETWARIYESLEIGIDVLRGASHTLVSEMRPPNYPTFDAETFRQAIRELDVHPDDYLGNDPFGHLTAEDRQSIRTGLFNKADFVWRIFMGQDVADFDDDETTVTAPKSQAPESLAPTEGPPQSTALTDAVGQMGMGGNNFDHVMQG